MLEIGLMLAVLSYRAHPLAERVASTQLYHMPSCSCRQAAAQRSVDAIFPVGPEGQEGEMANSWSLSHLGYLYPGTTPIVIKLDNNRSCPWVYIAQVTKAPTIITKVP